MSTLRNLVLALLLIALVAPAPAEAAAPAPTADAAPPLLLGPVGAHALYSYPAYADDPRALDALVLAQLEQQGLFAPGTLAMLAATAPRPPEHIFKDATPTCDLDGDGTRDFISNNLELDGPPSQDSGISRVAAVSGADGAILWKVDELDYASQGQPRAGVAFPAVSQNGGEVADANGDGVCDFFAYGFNTRPDEGTRVPVLNDPSITIFATRIMLVSGADGSTLWETEVEGLSAGGGDPFFASVRHTLVLNLPTGFLPYESPEGPRLAMKFTDTNYTVVQPPVFIGLGALFDQVYGGPIMRGPLYYQTLTVTEKVRVYDGETGSVLWETPIGGESDGRFTNFTWLADAADFTGDGEPDVLLDQLAVSNPRGTEIYQPFGGPPLFEYGRGMRVTALDGATGDALWTNMVLDPLAVDVNPPQEETKESLSFTHAQAVPDMDGDGRAEVIASYVAQEIALSVTVEGSYRTHFVPISGANGTTLWDVRQQGWGFATVLDDEGRYLGLGMVDVPTGPSGGRFPPKFVRLVALNSDDGTIEWSYEKAFSQNSYLSYNHALAQFREALAPHDWTGDGVRDMLTPSQYNAPTGQDQVLLATSTHTYEIKSGTDGSTVRTIRAWGPDGRIVACEGAEDKITVISGHARRYDVTRFDPLTGRQEWREPVFNDPAPHAATTAVDLLGVGARCGADGDGRTMWSLNLFEFSFARRSEIVALHGVRDEVSDARTWADPPVMGEPPTDILLAAAPDEETLEGGRASWLALVIAGVLGAAAALLTLALLKRMRVGRRLLGVTMVLLLLAPTVGAGVALPAALPAADEAPRALDPALVAPDAPTPTDASIAENGGMAPSMDDARVRLASRLLGMSPEQRTPLAVSDAVQHFLHESGYQVPPSKPAPSNDTAPGYTDNTSISYTYRLPDVDGDGVQDVAVDMYCTDFFACDDSPPFIQDPVRATTTYICEVPHQLYVLSGRDGSVVWRLDLNMITPIAECGRAFVLGVAPLEGGRAAFILYRHTTVASSLGATFVGAFALLHEIELIDAATGLPIWRYEDRGVDVNGWLNTHSAQNLLVLPLLRAVPDVGAPALQPSVTPALFLQGIGFEATAANDLGLAGMLPISPLGMAVVVVDSYDPIEWAARLDLETGAELWRVDTFQPTPPTSVLPVASTLMADSYYMYQQMDHQYWGEPHCCTDLTGDGEPDLVYRVYEWSTTPNANVQGPYLLSTRLVVIDGATGGETIDIYLTRDVTTPLRPRDYGQYGPVMALPSLPGYKLDLNMTGDVNGDGAPDLVVEEQFLGVDYMHVLSMRSGTDGAELWRLESPRDLRILAAGDANGDGAPDLLMVDWYGWENAGVFFDDYAEPGATPLKMLSGADGTELWRAVTYQAPADVILYYETLMRNGLPDLDLDGVADVVVDEPQYLGDQTVIHTNHVLSGATGRVLFDVTTVGAFSVPARLDDMTGDGRDDLVFLSGDVNDLWITVFDGTNGAPQWSRRLAAVAASSYAQALPNLRYHVLHDANGTAPDLAINMHLDVITVTIATVIYIFSTNGGSGAREVVYVNPVLVPQILQVDGRTGGVSWSLPPVDAATAAGRVIGATPGTKAYDAYVQAAQATAVDEARAALPQAVPTTLVFLAAYAAIFIVGALVMRARAKDQEVPDLA